MNNIINNVRIEIFNMFPEHNYDDIDKLLTIKYNNSSNEINKELIILEMTELLLSGIDIHELCQNYENNNTNNNVNNDTNTNENIDTNNNVNYHNNLPILPSNNIIQNNNIINNNNNENINNNSIKPSTTTTTPPPPPPTAPLPPTAPSLINLNNESKNPFRNIINDIDNNNNDETYYSCNEDNEEDDFFIVQLPPISQKVKLTEEEKLLFNNESEKLNDVLKILEIFPDCQVQFIGRKLNEYNDVEQVIDYLFDNPYPHRSELDVRELIGPRKKWDEYVKYDFETNEIYRNAAINYLQLEYNQVPENIIIEKFSEFNYHYAPTKQYFENFKKKAKNKVENDLNELNQNENDKKIEEDDNDDWLPNQTDEDVKESLVNIEFENILKNENIPILNNPKTIVQKQISWDMLLIDELDSWEEKCRKEQEEADQKLAEEIVNHITKTEFECSVCCCEYDFTEALQCSEGHLCCSFCLKQYAETKLFGENATILNCMESEKCQGTYPDEQLKCALPEKVYQKYQEVSFNQIIDEVDLPDLVTCFNCEFRAELPSELKIFLCPRCHKQTCRDCKEESHIGKICHWQKDEAETSARTKIEEAMTEARIRTCPKCKNRFFKLEGCNKMTCKCKTLICYLCRKKISGYEHFCRKAHCKHESCGKCILFTETVDDDIMAMKEAALKMKGEVLETLKNEGFNFQFDIDQLLEEAKKNGSG